MNIQVQERFGIQNTQGKKKQQQPNLSKIGWK